MLASSHGVRCLEGTLAHFHCERFRAAQTIDSAQENLDLAEGHGGLVLRNHVAGELNSSISQTALRMRRAHDTRGGESAVRVVRVGGDDEVVARGGLETLEASPGGVLNLENGAVRNENHVEKTVRYNDVLCTLNDTRKNGKS